MVLTKRGLSLAFICFVLAASAALASPLWILLSSPLVVDQSEISINSKGERAYNNRPYTGQVVAYSASGQVIRIDHFVNGRREGAAKRWFADGLLSYEVNYVAGVREGVEKSWWFNGNPRSETHFVNGKAEGEAWSWYRSGQKFKRFNYTAGKPTGLQQGWRRNGTLFTNFEYKNGRIYGLRKSNTCVGLEDETISIGYYKSQELQEPQSPR